MDWSSVVPALITGTVGIVGVAGSVLSARIAGKSMSQRDQLAEKRRIYADYYKTAWQTILPLDQLTREASPGSSEEELETATRAAYDNVYEAIGSISAELTLIESDNVMLAQQIFERYLRKSYEYYGNIIADKHKAQDDVPSVGRLRELLWNLQREMRRDLGT
jgi:hypothetical protein